MPISLSGSLNLTGSLTTTGQIVAQTLVVQTITSSIVYLSGSNTFGNDLTNIQQMTGSLRVTGSGNHYIVGGNVGIGTASPGDKLTVDGNIFLTGSARSLWIGNNGDSLPRLRLHHNGTDAYIDYSSSLYIRSGAPSIRATFDSSGNLGLGVTPSAWWSSIKAIDMGSVGAVFATTGSTLLSLNSYYDGTNWKYKTTATATYYEQTLGTHAWFYAASGTAGNTISFTQAMTLDSSGNLGVRATSMSYPLTRNGITLKASGTDGAEFVILSSADTGFTGAALIRSGADFSVYNRTNGLLAFGTNDTTRMTITSGGNVGIGTTSPSTALEVAGSVRAYLNSLTSTELFAENNTVKVRLIAGTTSSILSTFTNHPLIFETNNTERMRIFSSGNVFIGSSPSDAGYKLDVNGTGRFSGALLAGNTSATRNTIGTLDIGLSGGGYVTAGYNIDYTASANTYNYKVNDVSWMIDYGNANAFRVRYGISGTAGNAISYSNYLTIASSGAATFSSSVTANGNLIVNLSNGVIRLIDNGTSQVETNIRHTSTRNGVLTFTEEGVSDRWAIGTKPSDGAIYFSAAFDLSNIKLTLFSSGISCFSGTVCSPCFATISDYRMKSNLRPIDGLSIIMNTKPYKFEYNYDCSTSFGVIAHELQEIVPEAVFGEKDGEVMQGVDYMKLLPIAIKAIQELKCENDLFKTCLGIL